MKVIDFSNAIDRAKSPSLIDKMLDTLRQMRAPSAEVRSQERVVSALGRVLDNRFFLLRAVRIEGLDIAIPMTLVGPTGVRVLYPCALHGVFRVNMDNWEQMDDNQQRFRTVKPNILTRTSLMARTLGLLLSNHGLIQSEVEPVVVFSDPGTHVDTIRPTVRVVLLDGIGRFITGVLQSRSYLEKPDVQKIVDLLSNSTQPGILNSASDVKEDAFSFQDQGKQSQVLDIVDRIPRGDSLVNNLNKIPFTSGQWILIVIIAIVNIILLVGFVLLILFTT